MHTRALMSKLHYYKAANEAAKLKENKQASVYSHIETQMFTDLITFRKQLSIFLFLTLTFRYIAFLSMFLCNRSSKIQKGCVTQLLYS